MGTVVVFDVIPDIPDSSTLMFDFIPGIRALLFDVIPDSRLVILVFDVISNNIAGVDEVISEKCNLSESSTLLVIT